MRKLIWGCAASGALAICGAFAAAHHAVRHPSSLVGRALHGASHVAAYANPYSGFAPLLAQLHALTSVAKDEVAVEVEGVPSDPTPEAAPEPHAGGPIEAPAGAAPIVIPESKPAPVSAPGETTEVPPGDQPAAPATMPPVEDGEECELPMPTEGPAAEHRSWWQMVTGWFMPSADKLSAKEACEIYGVEMKCVPEQKRGECREDPHHHRHYPGCPYTGRPHCPLGERPAAMPPLPARSEGGEEPSEDGALSAARKAIRQLRERGTTPAKPAPAGPGVDTMEYRLSDQPLADYGPRPL